MTIKSLEDLHKLRDEAEAIDSEETAEYPSSPEEEDNTTVEELNDPNLIKEDVDPEPSEEEPSEIETEEEPSEFTFDPKIKVMDSEVEVPEFLAKNVSNEEQAKEIKELYEKAYGLDAVKEKRDHFKNQVQEWEGKYNEVNQELSKTNENLDFLDNLIKTGDMHTFQQYAGINDEQILKRAAEIIQYRELTPMQKAEYDRNIQSRQRQYSLEFENQNLRQSHEVEEVRKTEEALDTTLSNDSFKNIATEFDERVGYGAFRKEVIRRAMFIEQSTGKSLSPQEAIEETVRSLGLQPRQVETSPETTQKQTTDVPVEQRVVVRADKPVMTGIKAGSKSPVKPKVNSVADLRKLAQQFEH